jgi:hypothetical protein
MERTKPSISTKPTSQTSQIGTISRNRAPRSTKIPTAATHVSLSQAHQHPDILGTPIEEEPTQSPPRKPTTSNIEIFSGVEDEISFRRTYGLHSHLPEVVIRPQPIGISQLNNGETPIRVTPTSEIVHGEALSTVPSTSANIHQQMERFSKYSLHNPHYRVLFEKMVKECGPRCWETTRRDFLCAADRDGLSFFTGQKIQLSMKNLYWTLAKRGFAILNYPTMTPLPHLAGTEEWGGDAKGFSGLPKAWLKKVRNQISDPELPLCFEQEAEPKG